MTLLSFLFSKYKWIDWYKYVRHNTLSTNSLDKNILILSRFNKNMNNNNNKPKLKNLTSNILEDIEYNVSYHGLSILLELFGLISISLSLYKIVLALFFNIQIYTKSVLLVIIASIVIMSLWTFITLNRSLLIVKEFYNVQLSTTNLFKSVIESIILFYTLEVVCISEIFRYKILTNYSSIISIFAILIIWPMIISINVNIKLNILNHYKTYAIINSFNKKIDDSDAKNELFLKDISNFDVNDLNKNTSKLVLYKYINYQRSLIKKNKQNRNKKIKLDKNI